MLNGSTIAGGEKEEMPMLNFATAEPEENT